MAIRQTLVNVAMRVVLGRKLKAAFYFTVAAAASALIGDAALNGFAFTRGLIGLQHAEHKLQQAEDIRIYTREWYELYFYVQSGRYEQPQTVLERTQSEPSRPDIADTVLMAQLRKALWFSLFPACDYILTLEAEVLEQAEENPERYGDVARNIRQEVIWSRCDDLRAPSFVLIEGIDNEWRRHLLPYERYELPRQVERTLDAYRTQCTSLSGDREERSCQPDEWIRGLP